MSQYICMSSHYAIYFKLIQCCMSVISQYNWGGAGNCSRDEIKNGP